ncbi:MAG: LamG-like jellyroll fold domain-containing protein [Enterobacteriaceae bacterium]|nr:LamG-like jellyroll fold domain-containing protein [Enterobacteriaceae bacterium]
MSYALNLVGNPSYLSAPNSTVYNFGTGDFTLQCWVKTRASGTVISRKATEGGAGNGGFLLVIKPGGLIKLATDNGFGFYEINTVATHISDGNWHFLTGVRQNNQLSVYVDGTLVSSSPKNNITPPVNVNNGLPLYIGAAAQRQEQYNQFNGELDEVRVWNIALSAAQISTQMNQPLTGTEPGLVTYYTFDGQNATDQSPSHNNASPVGAVAYSSPGVFSGEDIPYIERVEQAVKGYFNQLSGPSYIRIMDTPHIWGMDFGRDIMTQARNRQRDFSRAIDEIIQKTKFRCDVSSLNSPDPDWQRVIFGAIDTCLTQRMGRTQPTQFRFFFGQTPTTPVGEPANYTEFKAGLIRLIQERGKEWEVMPEIWMGRFYRLGAGIISAIQAKVFGSAVIGVDDTKMTWNHTKIISMDGTSALVGGHNLNMDLFRSYPPVHDVSVVVHGKPAQGSQLFLNQMWVCGKDLITKETLNVSNLSWQNKDSDPSLPRDPFVQPEVAAYLEAQQKAIIALHKGGVQSDGGEQEANHEEYAPASLDIRDQDLKTLLDLKLPVFPLRVIYTKYAGFEEYKLATRNLVLGKYWNGPDPATSFQKAAEIMKEQLIKHAKKSILMSQMDLVSAWKKNWSDHKVCQWLLEALLNNTALQVQIVVSPLDAGAGAAGDQYSFGSGASRTFELMEYYMTHDVATDAPISDPGGVRANALKRLHIAPLYYTDKVPANKTQEGVTYKWPDLSPEGYTATLKQPPLSVEPPVKGVIGSAAWAVINASGYIYSKVPSAPGNHAKIMIIDDEVYVVGSDNLYPGFLSEIDYLVEGKEAVSQMINTYWNPLWQYSGPHSISGSSDIRSNYLKLLEPLGVNGTLISSNRQYFAIMQADGNLCVYQGTPHNQGKYVWGSQKTGPGGQFFTVVQADGNLCTYFGTMGNQGKYLWGTQRLADGGKFFLIMQDDGNLCVYKGTGPQDQGAFVWGSKN